MAVGSTGETGRWTSRHEECVLRWPLAQPGRQDVQLPDTREDGFRRSGCLATVSKPRAISNPEYYNARSR